MVLAGEKVNNIKISSGHPVIDFFNHDFGREESRITLSDALFLQSLMKDTDGRKGYGRKKKAFAITR